jgi:hypothetical protein
LHSHLSYETTPRESMTSVPSLCPEGTTSGGYWVHHWVALESVGPRACHALPARPLTEWCACSGEESQSRACSISGSPSCANRVSKPAGITRQSHELKYVEAADERADAAGDGIMQGVSPSVATTVAAVTPPARDVPPGRTCRQLDDACRSPFHTRAC